MSQIRLLLVDDEEEFVRTMAARLALRQVDSRVALSGEEALREVASEAPDVMVLDLRMPGIDGMEVLSRVKAQHPHVQVVILTGHGSADDAAEARRRGAFDYLEKPADAGQLLGVIHAAWKKSLEFLRSSSRAFGDSMTAAALAEAGLPEQAVAAMERDEPSAPSAAGEAGPLRVVFVDDEEDFVRTMAERMAMRDLGGQVALSGPEALELAATEPPHVMVLDLRMPGMDGMEVLRQVKRTHPRVEVVIMTGHGSDQDEAEARRLGAFAYLRKPVDIMELVDAVRRAGEASRAAAPSSGERK